MFSQNVEGDKLDWMYKGATNLVDREEYLLGRPVDKTLEQLNSEEKQNSTAPPKNHVEHECIPPSIRDFNKVVQVEQIDLSAKLQEDPLVLIKKRAEETRRQFLENPVQLKKLQKAMEALKSKKKKKKKKKSKDKKIDFSKMDIDAIITAKLKMLRDNPSGIPDSVGKVEKKSKEEKHLDTILIHKFIALRDFVDLHLIMNNDLNLVDSDSSETSDEEGKKKMSSSSSEDNNPVKRKSYMDKSKPVDSIRHIKSRSRSPKQDNSKLRRYNERRIHENDSRRHTFKHPLSEEDTRQKGNRGKLERHSEKYKDGSDSSVNKKHISNNTKSYRSRSVERKPTKFNQHHKSDTKDKLNPSRKTRRISRSRSSSGSSRGGKRKKHTTKRKSESESDSSDSSSSNTSTSSSSSSSSENNAKHKKIVKPKGNPARQVDTNSGSTKEKRKDSSSDSSEDDEQRTSYSKSKINIKKYSDSSDDSSGRKKDGKNWGLVKSDGSKLPLRYPSHREEHAVKKEEVKEPVKSNEKKKSRKLTEEEKEKLRLEMMANAEWREKDRQKNIKYFKEKDKKESNVRDFDPDFIHKELRKSANISSVESRIRSNVNNIQRSSKHMDTHFSKRT